MGAERPTCVCSIGHPGEEGWPPAGNMVGCVACPVHGPFGGTIGGSDTTPLCPWCGRTLAACQCDADEAPF